MGKNNPKSCFNSWNCGCRRDDCRRNGESSGCVSRLVAVVVPVAAEDSSAVVYQQVYRQGADGDVIEITPATGLPTSTYIEVPKLRPRAPSLVGQNRNATMLREEDADVHRWKRQRVAFSIVLRRY